MFNNNKRISILKTKNEISLKNIVNPLKDHCFFFTCLEPPGGKFSFYFSEMRGPLFCHEEAAWTGGQKHGPPMVGENDTLAGWCT